MTLSPSLRSMSATRIESSRPCTAHAEIEGPALASAATRMMLPWAAMEKRSIP